MSYILDALRKAERDRNLGRTPSLGDVTARTIRAPSRRPSTRTLALIGLVVVLLICTVALWPRNSSAPEPQAPQPELLAAQPPAPPAPAILAPPPVPAPDVAAAAPAPSAAAEGALDPEVPADSIDDLMDEPAAPSVVMPDDTASGVVAMDAAPASEDASATAPAEEEEEPSEPPAVEQSESAPEVPLLRDMPADYRGAFPELRVDVHVYDEDAARRWILVNGHKAVEGSTLSEGPTVSRITPEGIVFDFRGRSVLFPLNR